MQETKGAAVREGRLEPLLEEEELEIDLRELFFAIRKRILYVLLAALLGGGLSFFVSRFVLTPMYTSTSMLYIMSKETTLTSLADLQIGAQLTKDYRVLVTSRTVMEKVIEALQLPMDYTELRNMIRLENPSDTRILNISVTDSSAEMAKQIADTVAECASDYIADIMEQNPPKIIEKGKISHTKTSPKTRMDVLLAMLVSACAVVAYVSLKTILDDTIKTEDDIQNSLRLPVLAVIPEKAAPGKGKAKTGKDKG